MSDGAKVIFELPFTDSEDQKKVKRMMAADDGFAALDEIDGKIRNLLKHGQKKDFEPDAIVIFLEGLRDDVTDSGVRSLYE